MKRASISRREFAKSAAVAATAFSSTVAWTQAGKRIFRVGLLGCGGRGNGALDQHIEASKILNAALNLGVEIKVVDTADWFKDCAESAGRRVEWKAMLEDPNAQPDLYNLRMKPSYEEIENGTGELPKENEIPHAGVPA